LSKRRRIIATRFRTRPIEAKPVIPSGVPRAFALPLIFRGAGRSSRDLLLLFPASSFSCFFFFLLLLFPASSFSCFYLFLFFPPLIFTLKQIP
jgi:hypothetical protein